MSHRSFRSTLVPVTSGLVAAIAVSCVVGSAPALAAAGYTGTAGAVQAQEWWLGGLHVKQAWQTTEGAGVTVALLGTGVAAGHPDLAGSVTTGPDFSRSGRTAGGPFWGIDGTAVAGIIAGHGHGTGREAGLLGIAPAAKILSIRVNLEYNDPLGADAAVAGRLPAAIAEGITYAVDHGARVIDLPLDPGTTGLTGQGDPAAAGGSPAERAAVAYALSKDVVLVAPAGDDGQGRVLVDYPAAYRGVIAVGAVGRGGQLASFSSRRSYVALTAPGVGLVATVPPDDYTRISSTSTSSGIVAGVAALILSRYPDLTVAQVTQALTGATTHRSSAPGAGRGTIDAARAVAAAAAITAASQPVTAPSSQPAAAPSRPDKPAQLSTTADRRASAGTVAGSLVRYVVAGLCALIVLLVVLLLVVRSRRERPRTAAGGSGSPRARPRGQHEHRRPGQLPAAMLGASAGSGGPGRSAMPGGSGGSGRSGVSSGPGGSGISSGSGVSGGAGGPGWAQPTPAGPPTSVAWAAAGGWQGGSLGEMQPSSSAFGPVMTPAPKPARTGRTSPGSSGPPWAPAPEPESTIGPLPVVANSALPPDPGPGIRVPGDMAAQTATPPDGLLPMPFDLTTPPDPDFPPRPAADDGPGDFPGLARAPGRFPGRADLPSRQSLGFAAAPVDYAPPQAPDFTVPSPAGGVVLSAETAEAAEAGPQAPRAAAASGPAPAPGNADPSYIWDLAATDVFPAAADPGPPPEAPGAVPADDDPGASDS